MEMKLQDDLQQTDQLLQLTKDFSSKFLAAIDQLPADKQPGEPVHLPLPVAGMGGAATLELFQQQYGDDLAAPAGPRYWGFVTGGVTPAALMGDWITSAMDLNSSDKSSVAFHIERETITLLRSLLGLPDDFLGAFVSGATMANLTGLAIGRQWLGQQRGIDIGRDGMAGLQDLRVVSALPHSSIGKALSMLGMGRDNIIRLSVPDDRECVDIAALKNYLEANKGVPLIYVANAGTVNTVDFDDIAALVALKKEYGFWLHIDAAFGGFAACSDTYKHLLQGWEAADSITIDAHKWLNVPYDSAMIFSRHPDLQVAVFQNAGAAYLGDPAANFNFINYIPENSRRLRALPAWFSLMAYGKEGYKWLVENDIILAKELGMLLQQDNTFTLLAPVRMCVVCFTLNVPAASREAAVDAFLEALNSSGVVCMTRTVYKGVPGIRAALVNWRTTTKDVLLAYHTMKDLAATIVNQY
ncbi:pyridoxal phosphate-dependent decarboxylase family protein [Chitinophaga nivalis]|uniref:Pyridoxal-dependent decarboxylase n=1 Tax=Chitinophaga nivalis TaxID=2991709 RepID=A0ABT3IPN9_9BACT|nr:pyridoxal-dependent decarboxylase [Chitinophaga nivalis]MCW3464453.1 pyridoxal-dependent decarboxylase [Chitinophaga nivalis]MCW3485856.1 pyridoxal-dependent decarboxylase [Chitinophaga nivalis]